MVLKSKLCCLALIVLIWPQTVAAAPKSSLPQGISISPFIQNVNLQPGQLAQTIQLTLTNHTSDLQELDLSVHDFGSLNDSGGIILEGNSTYSQKYGLASWLSLDHDTVILNPGEAATVSATIDNRSSLQPGGHYGAVVASVNNFNQPSGNAVAINQQLMALILIDKMGGEHYDLKLTNFSHNGNWLHLPNDVRLTFQNPGNVHVIPKGIVKLKNPAGNVLAQGVINGASAFILPESFRQIYVPLTTVSSQPPLPGPYKLEVDYSYEGYNQYASQTYYLNFMDLKLYVLILLILGGLFGLWRHYRRRPPKA